ncbi:carbohydrate ABC transporter permease [Paenibacillus hexagrammi]|uniref:Carbohydrate ABC transporter permease n=1 Tax=Paenibacillus hexagrammi TaxID=2908839 RepID=A0ABY3SNM7_9BACL|nr:carbohydrate ABC transporter permease [Paenibacillus sp. YPD9-1]UJF34821.1 carbohydrate ABC transporter permease [Paenibacillus sp. YPD9-1]
MNDKRIKYMLNAAGLLICALWLVPLVWMVITAFKPDTAQAAPFLIPSVTLDNFKDVLHHPQANVGLWILNSTVVAVLTTAGVLILCTLAAFAFSRLQFAGKTLWFILIMAGLMIPREATLIPLYILFKDMNLLNTYFSIIAPSLAAPFGLIIMKQFFDGLPEQLFEAAKLDGCGLFRTLFVIAIPLTKPALASLGIFIFLAGWNDFLWPFLSVTDPKMVTIPIGLPVFRSQYLTGQGLTMAASALLSAPIIIVFIWFQKYIVKGIAMTGIKG